LRKNGSDKEKKDWLSRKYAKYFFVAPCIIYLLIVGIFPLIYSLVLCFYQWDVVVNPEPIFIGFGNFLRLFQDFRFWITLKNTCIFVVGAITLQFSIGLGLALLLNREIKGQGTFRLVFLTPMMLTGVAVGYTWRMLYHVTSGPLNYFLHLLGLPSFLWLADSSTALISMILVDTWQWTPFIFITLLAGLQSLPPELYEAAEVDGANNQQMFKHITLPLLYPVMLIVILLRSVEVFKIFDIIFICTGGGPGISTETITMYIRTIGMTQFSLGYAAAMSYIFLIIAVGMFFFLIVLLRRRRELFE